MRLIFAAILLATPAAAALPDGMRVVNVHEHIQSTREAGRLLAAMDATGVDTTLLMGSSWFTVTLNQQDGFTRVDWNNQQILWIAERHPGRFQAWPTIDPLDPDKLKRLEEYVAKGATGLKLYLGHGLREQRPTEWGYFFHKVAIDDVDMLPVYAYCEQIGLPIMLHVNPGPTAPGFAEEFISVLQLFPDLKVIAPHFILSSIKSSRLRAFLDAFPNVYSDVSFGHDDFLVPGLKRISKNPRKYRKIIRDYPGRFMFGTDVVVTEAPFKDADWIAVRMRAYLDMLRKAEYETPLVPGKKLRGLALPPDLLAGVLHANFDELMRRRPHGTKTRPVRWDGMGIPWIGRELGEMTDPDLWKKKKKGKHR
ncbi:MAG: amidohydrolase family protein [Myxococcales bacterium]|nr:amidohydrolase family protein [Myxococcales bacterium]